MKSNTSLFFSAILPIVCAIALLLSHLTGCGGGVTGTGDIRGTQVEGRVFKTDGAPLEGAQVTLVETGDSTTVDAQGEFLIRTDLITGDLTLSVVSATINAAVRIGSVSEAEPNIRVELQVDEAANTIEVISVTKPTPIPTSSSSSSQPNTPSSNETPNPSATSIVGAEPTGTPIAIPTSVATATPTQVVPASVRFSGVVRQVKNENPVSGATVQIFATGASGVTNNAGTFSFDSTAVQGDVTVVLAIDEQSAQAIIDDMPPGTTNVFFEIRVKFTSPTEFTITIPTSLVEFSDPSLPG